MCVDLYHKRQIQEDLRLMAAEIDHEARQTTDDPRGRAGNNRPCPDRAREIAQMLVDVADVLEAAYGHF